MTNPPGDHDNPPYAHLMELTGVDETTAKRLYDAGYTRFYHITATSQNKIKQIEGISPELAVHIKKQAENTDDNTEPAAATASSNQNTPPQTESHTPDWPMEGGDPQRSNARPEGQVTAIDADAGWGFSANVGSLSSSTIADERLYLTGGSGLVLAADLDTGEFAWSFEMDPDHSWGGGPAVAGDTVFAAGYYGDCEGVIYALDAGDGSVRWQYETAREPSDPVVVDGTVYTGYTQYHGNIVALDGATGVVKWTSGVESALSAPVAADGTVYVGAGHEGGHVYALDATSGEVRWSTELATERAFTPIVTDEAVYSGYITGDAGTVFELDPASGHIRRQRDVGGIGGPGGVGAPTCAHGHLYATTHTTGEVYAIDLADGEIRWSREIGNAVRPVVVGDHVFVGATDRDSGATAVYAFEAESGTPRRQLEFDGRIRSAPASAGETLYVPHGQRVSAVSVARRGPQRRSDRADASASDPTPDRQTAETATPEATEWPIEGGDTARTSSHPRASPPTAQPSQRWFFDGHTNRIGGSVTVRSPTVREGTV
jgi:outer membrane protein assembly factor BamB